MIDEAIKMASVVTAGNDKSILLVLEPQHHGSMDKFAVVKHRRLLEDKVHLTLSWKTNACQVINFQAFILFYRTTY